MAQLRQDYSLFRERQTEVIVIGPEGPQSFRRYWEKNDLPFPGVPNPSHSVLKAYGQEVKLFKFGRMPAQVIVDRNGIARFVHYGKSMDDIPDTTSLLKILDELNREFTNPKNHPEVDLAG
jgi:peroxiredoxin Q/BCP